MASKFFKFPFGVSGTRTAIPDALQVDGSVSYTEGYTVDYQKIKSDPTSKNIERDKMNSLEYEITNVLLQLQSYGAPDFITSADNGGSPFSYAKGAHVVLAGVVYESNVAANVTTPPGGSWTVVGNTGATYKQIQPLTASVAASALTVTIAPTTMDFRNATLGNGTPNTRILAANASVVVPSGATLGTISAQASRIMALLIDNAGTLEAAVVNIAGGVNLDETGVISTTAISAAATSAGVVYSTTARSNVPYRVVGAVDSSQVTAGTWATAPSLVVGAGGNALDSMQSLGYGQTYQIVSGSRVFGTTYYNTTGKPLGIFVRTTGVSSASVEITASINGGTAFPIGISQLPSGSAQVSAVVIVPPGASYNIAQTGGVTVGVWTELR